MTPVSFSASISAMEIFARAGGDGSSSGGGSSGGILLIGYIPMHFIGARLRRLMNRGENVWIVANIVG